MMRCDLVTPARLLATDLAYVQQLRAARDVLAHRLNVGRERGQRAAATAVARRRVAPRDAARRRSDATRVHVRRERRDTHHRAKAGQQQQLSVNVRVRANCHREYSTTATLGRLET